MKRITGKHAKRSISAALVLAMCGGLLPAPAHAAGGTVAYHRAEPETAVFNYYTGNLKSLYDAAKGDDAAYRYYNAVSLYGHKYEDRAKNNDGWDFTYNGGSLDGTTLQTLMQVQGNLEIGFSASLKNRAHSHSHYKFPKNYKTDLTSYESMELRFAGRNLGGIYGSSELYKEITRQGDRTYQPLYYSSAEGGRLSFAKSSLAYEDFKKRTCSCDGVYAEKVFVSFRDTRLPELADVQYSTDGGATWVRRWNSVRVKNGGTVLIKLRYDEPLRFADDKADHNLNLRLQAYGSDVDNSRKAPLIELDGNDLIFSYTVQNESARILTLDTGELFGSGIPLVQLRGKENGGGSFTIDSSYELNSQTRRDGISTSRCYITDLAGNPLPQENISSANLILDSQAPYVENVEFDLGLNNADVKAMLGTKPDDLDNSDRYLGAGDTVTLRLKMNERMALENDRSKGWSRATATTNIIENGSPVTTRARLVTPYSGTDLSNTAILFEPITIRSGMTVAGDEIKVTRLDFEETVYDLAGNAYGAAAVAEDANTNPPLADVEPPEVKGGDDFGSSGYAKDGESGGFTYKLLLSDGKSGIEDLNASFTLHQQGDGRLYGYRWAITAEDRAHKDITDWETGTIGAAQPFKQLSECYLHIAPLENESYGDLSGCTLTVNARDYAGNRSETVLPGSEQTLDWYIDTIAPTVRVGDAERRLEGDTGILTVNASLSDRHGISGWDYLWTDDDTAPDENASWSAGPLDSRTTDGTPVEAAVTKKVASGENFAGYLWIKATDNADTQKNESAPVCLGRYVYNRTKVAYTLRYSSRLQKAAELGLSDISDGGTVVIMVQQPGTENRYAVLALTKADAEQIGTDNLFAVNDGELIWNDMTAEQDENGNYQFSDRWLSSTKTWWAQIVGGSYVGTLHIKVLAGLDEAFPRMTAGSQVFKTAPSQAGTDEQNIVEENFSLRMVGGDSQENFADVALTTDADEDTLRTTPAGVQFRASIGADNGGWNYEDLDAEHSYVVLKNVTEKTEYTFPLAAFAIADGAAAQTVVVPDGDYATGRYTAMLHIATHTGKEQEAYCGTSLYVDATGPDDDFTLQSIQYNPFGSMWKNPYGLKDTYGTRSCVEENGMVVIPVSCGYLFADHMPTGSADSVRNQYKISIGYENKIETTDLGGGKRAGVVSLKLWNTDDADNPISMSWDNTNQVYTNETMVAGSNLTGFAFSKTDFVPGKHLYLEPNTVNTIAMQKIYANGEVSSVKYIKILPAMDYLPGKAEANPETGRLVFTPDASNEGAAAAGAQVFAWSSLEGQEYGQGEGERLAMEAQPDGTWTCSLLPGSRLYTVITESANGALNEAGSAQQYAPRLTDWTNDPDGGMEGISTADNGDGTYTMKFRVRGDSALTGRAMNVNIGMTFAAGGEEKSAELALTADLSGGQYGWSAESAQSTGIYRVTAASDYVNYHRVVDFTVTGVYPSGADTMDAAVRVTDAFGNLGEGTQTGIAVTAQPPQAAGVTREGDAVKVTFSQPVRPAESWAWKEKDGSGFRAEWSRAFPIAGNGTHTIRFTDVFGNRYSQDVETNTFGDWGLELRFSNEKPTTEPVLLTTNADKGIVMVWKEQDGTKYGVPDINGEQRVQKRQTQFTDNAELEVVLYEDETMRRSRLNLRVYVDNIMSGAPEADVRYYIPAVGQEFTRTELEQYIADCGGSLTVRGNVNVWYKTSRHVTPTNDTGSEFLFTRDNQRASYTFTYVDDLNQNGSAEVSLPTGLTLDAPPEDHTPPTVSVDIYAKRANLYTREASFLPEDTEKGADDETGTAYLFRELSYVQGYSLTINARDDSGYTIAAGGDGAVLSGNTLTITKPGSYTVAVTDNSGFGNTTAFALTVPDMIDNEAPKCIITPVATSMYSKNWYITFTDNKDASLVALTEPAGVVKVPENTTDPYDKDHIGAYKYVVEENGTVQFAFRDAAGNVGTHGETAAGIDTEPPALTVRWSPPYIDENGTRDESRPTASLVNTSVTAHIESSKTLRELTVYTQSGGRYSLLNNGTAASHEIKDPDGKTLVRFAAKPDRITVTYYDNYRSQLLFEAVTPNGRGSTLMLGAVDTIDKTAPEIAEARTEMKRSGYTTPYAVKVTLTPNEQTTVSNYGKNGAVYDAKTPLELTVTENGTYNVHFIDNAGNLTIYPVKMTGIDNAAPVLTVSDLTDGGQTAAVEVEVDEPCVLTWGTSGRQEVGRGTHRITFDANGTYSITATDAAGNASFKTVRVGSIDRDAPSIRFSNTTIYLTAGSSADALNAELVKGCTVSDNVSLPGAITVDTDTSLVRLDTAGQYTVTYTVTDEAGNQTKATRLVRIIGANTICVNVDGKLILPDSTAVIAPGAHTLTLANSTGPYRIKARKGILSAGQMKYQNENSLSFAADGAFTVTNTGYYTVLVTTQSRETIRLLLYVER